MSKEWQKIALFLATLLLTNLGTNGLQFSRWTAEEETARTVRTVHLDTIVMLSEALHDCREAFRPTTEPPPG